MSAVLKFPNDTLLHKSILIVGNTNLTSDQKDFSKIFAADIKNLINSSAVVDEEHQDQILIYAALA